jgi:Concanavalin A-like lectin/glucanases superfamily
MMCKKPACLLALAILLGAVASTSADLVGYWPLNGDARDASGNGLDGTINGTVVPAPDRTGKADSAMSFSGEADSHIDLGNPPELNITGAMTLAAWVWLNGDNANNGRIIAKSGGGGQRSWSLNIEASSGGVTNPATFQIALSGTTNLSVRDTEPLPTDEWVHMAGVYRPGEDTEIYVNGELRNTNTTGVPPQQFSSNGLSALIGARNACDNCGWDGMIDEAMIFNNALSAAEIQGIMKGLGGGFPLASNPDPRDGALVEDTWVTLSWRPGDFAVSHDVYLGETFDDVNTATPDSNTFRGNQTSTFYVAGFPGYAYPDGLVPGTTYYWRIDEVNDAEPNSPWKGGVWSFSIPPKTAYNPDPANGAESVAVTAKLTWTAGFGAKFHTVYFGDDFDTVANATGGLPQGTTTYTPSGLKMAKTYYWRVDEFDGTNTYKGDIWSFTTLGAVGGPNPANGAVGVKPTTLLTWTAGALAASHEVYFGTDPNAVKNATKTSPEYKGSKALGDESYDPGKLQLETAYYWRIDEVNAANPDSPWKGNVWSFTTGDYYVIDDFESYTDDDANNLAIWQTWVDGFGIPDNGAQVGYLLPPYAEQTIVHGGSQSMPLLYNNTGGVTNSEASLGMTVQRDWTEDGVANLSLWFRGNPGSVGSFVEGPAGTYTMTATGTDIWNQADEFHFAYKMLTGVGSIEAQVLSVDNTDPWAKAGVMIRETLDAGSKFAAVYITPGNGCRFQARLNTSVAAVSDSGVVTTQQTAITAPYRVKLERDAAGNFRGYYSSDGTTWIPMAWNPQNIAMASNVYIGLALTAHNANATCTAKFSDVKMTSTVGPQWADQDVGIASNASEPLYVAVSNSTGSPAIMTNPDPNAATTTTWTQWVIPLQTFTDQGINLTNVDKLVIGLGTKGDATAAGGSGTMYFDDIRLDRPRTP